MSFVIRAIIDGRCMWLGDFEGPLFDTRIWVDRRDRAEEYTSHKRAAEGAAVAFKNCGITPQPYTAVNTTKI